MKAKVQYTSTSMGNAKRSRPNARTITARPRVCWTADPEDRRRAFRLMEDLTSSRKRSSLRPWRSKMTGKTNSDDAKLRAARNVALLRRASLHPGRVGCHYLKRVCPFTRALDRHAPPRRHRHARRPAHVGIGPPAAAADRGAVHQLAARAQVTGRRRADGRSRPAVAWPPPTAQRAGRPG
jgi:hypothetical protein